MRKKNADFYEETLEDVYARNTILGTELCDDAAEPEILINFYNDSDRTLKVHSENGVKCYELVLGRCRWNDEESLTEIKPQQKVCFFYPEHRETCSIPLIQLRDNTILVC